MLKEFVINANEYLNRDVKGFYHTEFYGRNHRLCNHVDNPTFLYKLKNDPHHNWTEEQLIAAANQLGNILLVDFEQILKNTTHHSLTVCVVPRAKAEHVYRPDQLFFKEVVRQVVVMMPELQDGTKLIK